MPSPRCKGSLGSVLAASSGRGRWHPLQSYILVQLPDPTLVAAWDFTDLCVRALPSLPSPLAG